MRRRLITLALIVSTPYVSAQQPQGKVTIHVGPVYTRSEASGVYPAYPDVQVQVELPPGATAAQAKPDAFSVQADTGARADAGNVQTLSATGYGLSAAVAIDVSGSMSGAPLAAVRSGLGRFVADAGPADKLAIETIADEGRWDAGWGDSRDHVRTALDHLASRGKLTRLWDGLLEVIHSYPAAPLARRLIVISDGHDEGSSHKEDEVIEAARERGVVVDAIGITRSDQHYLKVLDALTTRTGGQFRPAKSNAELTRWVEAGVARLQAIPVVSFRMDELPEDGRAHMLTVTWKHDGAQSSAKVVAILPAAAAPARAFWRRIADPKSPWSWAVAGAALVLAVGSWIILRSRKRPLIPAVAGAFPPAVVSAPAQAAACQPSTYPPKPAVAPRPVLFPSPRPREAAVPFATSVVVVEPARAKTMIGARFSRPAENQPAAWLLCESGFAPGQTFALEEAEFWIGALANNHLQIADDPTVSGNHACLVFDHEILGIYDHHSTNGTGVNNEVLHGSRSLLRPGDRIRIGQSVFVVRSQA